MLGEARASERHFAIKIEAVPGDTCATPRSAPKGRAQRFRLHHAPAGPCAPIALRSSTGMRSWHSAAARQLSVMTIE